MRRGRGWLESQRYIEERREKRGEREALTVFRRRIELLAEFCFDEAEDYREDDGG
jgi:hypothetical protein